jgi:hypothetical protein
VTVAPHPVHRPRGALKVCLRQKVVDDGLVHSAAGGASAVVRAASDGVMPLAAARLPGEDARGIGGRVAGQERPQTS